MQNLTELEQIAIDSPINLSDGHPRQDLTPAQEKVIGRLSELFETAQNTDLTELERRARTAFFTALGQHSAPLDGGVLSVYSSSVATMALAYVLDERKDRVALLHPTFDNIHDILARHVEILPVPEGAPGALDLTAIPADVSCVFVTTPNNPTGWYLSAEGLTELAEYCAQRDLLLCLDTSFRGFDVRTQFDSYAILRDSGVEYVVIEDTGKLWPVSELKVGFVATSPGVRSRIEHALSDVLLSVSPFVLLLVEALALDAAGGGFAEMRELVAANRAAVVEAVEGLPGIEVLVPDSRVSVCRLRFPTADDATWVRTALREHGVHVLPCDPFHWADPTDGSRVLRIALGRNTPVIHDAMSRLALVWRSRTAQ